MREAFARTLAKLAEADPRIILLSGDLGFGVLDDYRSKRPTQFLNVGVAEQNMTGVAAGMALTGRKVLTYSIANFPTLRCLEQVRNDICYHQANVTVISVGAGLSYGALGMSHHATEDISILRSLPGLRIFSPCDDFEVEQCLSFLMQNDGPGYLRLGRLSAKLPQVPDTSFVVGAPRLIQSGMDILFLTTGEIISEVMGAAAVLAEGDLSVGVASVHSLKPLDTRALVDMVRSYPSVVTVEEHTLCGGLGSIVAETLLDHGVHPRNFLRLGINDAFTSIVGDQTYLRKRLELDAVAIARKTKAALA